MFQGRVWVEAPHNPQMAPKEKAAKGGTFIGSKPIPCPLATSNAISSQPSGGKRENKKCPVATGSGQSSEAAGENGEEGPRAGS